MYVHSRVVVVGLYQTLHEKYESITDQKPKINESEKENDDKVKPPKGW